MKKIEILIVEDELIIAEKIKKILQDIGYSLAGTAISYQEGLTLFRQTNPDMMLVDIHLKGEKDGITLMKEIKEKADIPFIFITSYTDTHTVERAKQEQPSTFLVKPFSKEDLYTAIEVAWSNHNKNKENQPPQIRKDCIFVKSNQVVVKVKFKDILYIAAQDIYCQLVLKKSKHLVRSSLKHLQSKLPPNFIRTHKSYVVNFEFIDGFSYEHIRIAKSEIPLGRSYRDDFLKHIDMI